jgi:AsmA protein
MKKRLFATGAVGLLVLLVVGLWPFISARLFRARLEEAIGAALDRKVSIGRINVAPLSGGMRVDDLSIADDPAFSAAPFVTAKAIIIRLDLKLFIFSRRLRIESFRLEEPQVVLLRSASGSWNFSGLGALTRVAAGGSAPGEVLIQKATITNGRIVVSSPTAWRAYDDVSLDITDLAPLSHFPFHVSAQTSRGGTVGLDGQAGPLNGNDVAKTPFRAIVEVRRLDVASSGFVDPASGVRGLVDFSGALASDGRVLKSQGRVNATGVQILPGGSPASAPIEIDYESDYDPQTQSGVVKQGSVHIGKAVAQLTGNFDARGTTPTVRMELVGPKMPVTELETVMPAFGVSLPSGASLREGTLDAAFSVSGPIDRVVIAGPISLLNTTITGFDLAARLGTMASFAGLPKSGDTTIQTLGAVIRAASEGILVDSLNLVIPHVGSLSGGGTIAPTGDLNFRMLAKPSGLRVVSGGLLVASLGNGVPLRIQGTTSSPTFGPDVGRAVSGVINSPQAAGRAAGGALRDLFGRKKP